MKNIVALLAIVGCAVAGSSTGPPIPTCGWTSTIITEADHTETVPIPVASASCSASAPAPPSVSSSVAPVSSAAPAPPVVASTGSTGGHVHPSHTGPPIVHNGAAMPTAAPILLGALGLFAMM